MPDGDSGSQGRKTKRVAVEVGHFRARAHVASRDACGGLASPVRRSSLRPSS